MSESQVFPWWSQKNADVTTSHGSLPATGPVVRSPTFPGDAGDCRAAELGVKEKEEERQEELRRAQGQLKKCLDDGDYRGAAVAKAKLARS